MKGIRHLFLLTILAGVAGASVWLGGYLVKAQTLPAVPDLQSANAISACAVELRWNQPDSADYFNYSRNNSNSSLVPNVTGDGAKSFTQTQLLPARSYVYKVQACRIVGGTGGNCSAFSNTQTISTLAIAEPPATPTDLRVARWESNGSAAVLTWTPSATPPNSGFRIFRSDDGGNTFVLVTNGTIPLKSFQDNRSEFRDAVSTDVFHIYKIATYQTDASCAPVTSDTPDENIVAGPVPAYVRFSPLSPDFVVPPRPASVSVKEASNDRTRVNFEWSNVEGENAFQFEMSEFEDFRTLATPNGQPIVKNQNVLQTGFFTVQARKALHYRIRACTAVGCSEYRRSIEPYVSGFVGPSELSASVVPHGASAADVRLSWRDFADYYHRTRIYRKLSTEANFPAIPLAELPGSGCFGSPITCDSYPVSYTDANLSLGNRTYEYQVKFLVLPAATEESEPSKTESANLNLTFLNQWGWANVGDVRASTPITEMQWVGVTSAGNPRESCEAWLARTGQWSPGGELPRVRDLTPGRSNPPDAGKCIYITSDRSLLSPRIFPSNDASRDYSPASDYVGSIGEYVTEVRRDVVVGQEESVVGYLGIGWIRSAYDAVKSAWGISAEPPDSQSYGVAVDGSGKISGHAWTPNGGWLSFNNAELEGCPQIPGAEAPCEARINLVTGAVSGWAKFIGWGSSDGWVSLSAKSGEPAYGLIYVMTDWSPTTRVLTGQAWGGEVTGWLSFGDYVPPLPAPILRVTSPTETSLTLEWDNPVDYEKVAVSYKRSNVTNFGSLPGSDITESSLVSQGQNKRFIVPDLTSNTSYDFFLRGTKGSETSVSNIASGSTLAPGQAAGYTFICRANGTTSTLLLWVGPTENVRGLSILHGASSSTLGALATPNPGSGSMNVAVSANATRYYQLEVDYQTGLDVRVPRDGPISCTTLAQIPQNPEGLQVTPLGPSSLYVTWKDNATRPHNFVLERIKVTPAVSTDVTATRNGNRVDLSWRNTTNDQTFRSPYYHKIERSTDINPTSRFTADDGSYRTFDVAFSEDRNYNAATKKTTYQWPDAAPPASPVYYLVRACSLIKVDYDGNGSLDDVCTEGYPQGEGAVASAVSAPSGRVASFIGAAKDMVSNIAWRMTQAISRIADRVLAQKVPEKFVTIVDGAEVNLNLYFGQFRAGTGGVLSFGTNPGVYRDNNLVPNSVYLYRAKATYTDTARGETSYTNEGAAKTLRESVGPPAQPISVLVCIRNNLCGSIEGTKVFQPGVGFISPTNQCNTNADCRNVGTTRQFFEEQ
ncbi:MAG: fibronectin type III domain-containing protein [Candidatus Brennerbacteria bacterium]